MEAAVTTHANRHFSATPAEGLKVETDHATKLTYSIAEACRALGVGQTTVYDLIEAKRLRKVKLGRRALIPAESLRAFVASPPEDQPEHRAA